MSMFRKAMTVAGLEFRQWPREYKLYVIFALMAVFLYQHLDPLFSYADRIGYPASPWLLPFVASGTNGRMLFYTCAILYFSSIFNRKKINRYLQLRSGHMAYLLGKLFYIVVASLLYVLVFTLLMLLPRLHRVCLDGSWGLVLGSWSHYPDVQEGAVIASTYLTEWFEAPQATLFSFLLLWLGSCNLGIVIFLVNCLGGKLWGIVSGGLLVVLDMAVASAAIPLMQAYMMYVSPLSWSLLTLLRWNGKVWPELFPGVGYAFAASFGFLLLLGLLSVVLTKRSYRAGCKRQWVNLTGE